MNKKEILNIIYTEQKRVTHYYPYRTGAWGEEIARTDIHDDNFDLELKNFITLIISFGAALAGRLIDNKTAVKIEINQLPYPVYAIRYDGCYRICTDIKSENDGIKIIGHLD